MGQEQSQPNNNDNDVASSVLPQRAMPVSSSSSSVPNSTPQKADTRPHLVVEVTNDKGNIARGAKIHKFSSAEKKDRFIKNWTTNHDDYVVEGDEGNARVLTYTGDYKCRQYLILMPVQE